MYRAALLATLAACAPRPAPVQPPRSTSYEPNPQGVPLPVRRTGNQTIVPDDDTKRAIAELQSARVRSTWKLCADETGKVFRVETMTSTGFPAYDAAIQRELSQWTYEPYVVDGKPARWCRPVSLVYAQK